MTKLTRENVDEIFKLAMDVQGLEEERLYDLKRPCVFVRMSGHVAKITVEIYEKGWAPRNNNLEKVYDETERKEFYFYFSDRLDSNKRELEEYREYMNKLLKTMEEQYTKE